MEFTVHSYVILVPLLVAWLLIVHRRRDSGQTWWSREQFLARTAFVLYLASVVNLTLFPIHVATGDAADRVAYVHAISIVPFRRFELGDFVLNILMLMPLGFALGIFWPRLASVPVALVVGYGVGATIEMLQLVGRVWLANDRDVTANDIIANAIGAVLGVVVWKLAMRSPETRLQLEWLRDVDERDMLGRRQDPTGL